MNLYCWKGPFQRPTGFDMVDHEHAWYTWAMLNLEMADGKDRGGA